MWPFRRKEPVEARASIENPNVPISDPNVLLHLLGSYGASSGINVTEDAALGVPAVWCAVNFLGGTIGSLPLQLYRTTADGRELAKNDPLYTILHDEVNDDSLTSIKWRKWMVQTTMLRGRSFTFIERNKAGRVTNLWPLDPSMVTVKRSAGRTTYTYAETGRSPVTYAANEIIDIPFMLRADGITHENPISRLKEALGLAIALERYAAQFFDKGGVPPLAVTGPAASDAAIRRTKADVDQNIKRSNRENPNTLYLPNGFDIKQVGFNPEQGQLTEARLFQIQEIARVFGLPPSFLHDLSRGTFTNTEQQDLHFVKHTLTQWLELIEQELNAKLFTRRNRINSVEFNLDGLLRGDFATRMAGYATAFQNAILTPDEIRGLENRPAKGGDADKLHVQGATVPLGQQNMGQGSQPAPKDAAQPEPSP